MKLLVDAQLPRRFVHLLNDAGHDAIHTLDLPLKNKTKDSEINQISIQEQRIVITKDADFVNSFLIHRRPWKLLLISTGNIRNSELERLFRANLNKLDSLFDSEADFIELTRKTLIVHR